MVLSAERLAGRSAVLTGASRGIGAEVARALAAHGMRLHLVARSAMQLQAIAADLTAQAHVLDVSDAAAVAGFAERLTASAGVPDVVIHAAGAFELARIADTRVTSFDRQIAVNLRAAFLLMHAFAGPMMQRGSGHIVSIGSVAGRHAFPANGAYAASKFGLRGLHAVLDAELRGTGVRSTLVEPAATDTSLWDGIDAAAHPGLPARHAMLTPGTVADAVVYALTRPHDVAVRNIILERA